MRSLNHRKDVRSTEQFEKDIKLGAIKEGIWAQIFQTELNKTGKKWKIEEHGVDNSGKLIKEKLPNNNVDKIFFYSSTNIKTTLPTEIKTIPEYLKSFMTFKASSLLACEKNKACILVPKRYEYYLFSKRACIILYENYPKRIYWDFEKNKGFSPNDPAVRIYEKEIIKLINLKLVKVKKWGKESRKIIEKNWGVLSRQRHD